ncbi:hypothetical protein Q1695_011051 [Nippostrongylus brasiliensis]|nr:hypothetical protein Q1695_011051 [Nippostrongylus brasiliensis]
MLLRSVGLLLGLLAVQAAKAPDELSCDFRRPCCWQSLDPNTHWLVRNGRSININEYRRTFLVGKSRMPPAGNYLLQSSYRESSAFGSCAFCSADGVIHVQYRHWQSPTAVLKLCWRRWGQPVMADHCHPTEPSRQSQMISQKLLVPSGVDIQVLFAVEKSDGGVNAVVMIDRIFMKVKRCGANRVVPAQLTQQAVRTAVSPSFHPNEKSLHADTTGKLHRVAVNKVDLAHLAQIDDRVRMKILTREKERLLINQVIHEHFPELPAAERNSGEVRHHGHDNTPGKAADSLSMAARVTVPPIMLTSVSMRRISMKPPSKQRFIPPVDFSKDTVSITKTAAIPPPSPPAKPKDFDPLTDLLGKDLVNFLDPNYVSNDADEEEEDYEEKETAGKIGDIAGISKKMFTRIPEVPEIPKQKLAAKFSPTVVQTPSPLLMFHRPISLSPPQPCNTIGGCLFDRTMCTYEHPPGTPITSQFHRLKVGLSNFVRARVPPGTSTVLQTDTHMMEPHTVYFDVLEWKAGTRLIGCCSDMQGAQRCPFATPAEAGVLLWQGGSFDCPAYTAKIRFICENFGVEDGECGLDSIRLHRLSDTFLLEPCQKHMLPSI